MDLISTILTYGHQVRRLYWRIFEPTVVGVRALVVREGRVMLVRHTYLKGWYLPGGKVDRGETALTAVCREVAEECGLKVNKAKLAAIYSNAEQNRNDHILLFCIDDFEELPAETINGYEIAERGFFDLNNLPSNITAATLRRIAEYRAAQFDNPYW